MRESKCMCVVHPLHYVTITSWSAPKSHQRALHTRRITSQNNNSHNASYLGLITHSPAFHSDTPY